MKREKLWAVLPVAGQSRRMQDFKPLLPLGEKTILEKTIGQFQEAGICNIIAVTGYCREKIAPILDCMDVQEVYNPDYGTCDMLHSVKLGIGAVLKRERAGGVFVTPGDIPLIRPFTILKVIESFRESGAQVVIPDFLGKDGHPPLFSAETAARLLHYQGRGGLRGFLDSCERIGRVETVDADMLLDADTPEDYAVLLKAYRFRQIPDERTIEAIWNYVDTPERVRRHCRKVAETGMCAGIRMLEKVSGKEREWFLRLLQAGALLHDVMRAVPDHEEEGGRLLRRMGYAETADIIEAHRVPKGSDTDACAENMADLREAIKGILYCSDRLTEDDRSCVYEERYERKKRQFKDNTEALQKLERDRRQFGQYRRQLKELVGYDLFE